MIPRTPSLEALEALYRAYNRPEFVSPDPLQFLYDYPDVDDREIVGLVAACLAYGRVAGIIRSVGKVLDCLGTSPRRCLESVSHRTLRRRLDGFVHRFATGEQMAGLLTGMAGVIADHGSLRAAFDAGADPEAPASIPALGRFVDRITAASPAAPGHLLPRPERGSACKRLHLYLRWMVRRDAVDPGGWEGVIRPADLIIPLDVHIGRISRAFGFTSRRADDCRTALEITAGFAALRPDDPVRYDFALTRPGIRGDGDPAVRSGGRE